MVPSWNENSEKGEEANVGDVERNSLERMRRGSRGVEWTCDPPTCLEDVKGSILIYLVTVHN